MDFEGTLKQKFEAVRGQSARGPWAKQDVLFEVRRQGSKFPTNIVVTIWGEDKVNELASFHEGEELKVSFDLSSREYQGRWYTEARAWRFDRKSEPQNIPTPPLPTADDANFSVDSDEDLPF